LIMTTALGEFPDDLAPEPVTLTGALIGYARVSTAGQTRDREFHALTEQSGCLSLEVPLKRSRPPSLRTFLESITALAAGFFALLAAVWPDWIEAFGVDPDHGDGSLEWLIPVALAATTLILGLVARRHWRIDGARTIGT